MRMIFLFLTIRCTILFCHGACGGFCSPTRESHVAPSSGSMPFPTLPYLFFVTRRQAGSLRRCRFIKQMRCPLAFSELLMIREEFRLRQTTNGHELTRITARTTDATDIKDVRNQEARVLWKTPSMVVISTRRSEGPTSESLFAKYSRRVSDRFPHNRARCGCANRLFAAMESPSVAS